MLPDFPNAKKKLQASQRRFFSYARKQHLGPFFGNIPSRTLHEGSMMRQEYSKEFVHESNMKSLQIQFNTTITELKGNPFIVYEKWLEAAKEMADQQTIMTIKGVDELTTLTGNVVDYCESDIVEGFFETFEKVHIDFDSAGNPRLPTILGGPSFIRKLIPALEESKKVPGYQERMEQIIERKRQEWYDRENNRKLVD